jgi:hypothetical protein
VNPPTEGAIRADEARPGQLGRVAERRGRHHARLGRALALRFATGEWVEGNQVRVDWFDPATPTVSQREDALAKRKAAGVLSREGYWDELGWSEARKAKERAYFEAAGLSKSDARAIEAGSDISQVVNAAQGMTTTNLFGRNVKATTYGTTKRSAWRKAHPNQPVRLRPEAIYQIAGQDREEVLRLLRVYGYLTS